MNGSLEANDTCGRIHRLKIGPVWPVVCGIIFSFCSIRTQAAEPPSAYELLQAATRDAFDAAGLSPAADDFRAAVLRSEDWQHELFDSGPISDPGKAVGVLFALWEVDPSLAETPIDRAMATACGLEGARRYGVEGMVERYLFFRDHWRDGRLNDLYESLSVFERRFLAHGVQHGHFNTLASMEYQLAEVCLPADRYPGACWYASYRLDNVFGDSIHGPHYYEPFRASWPSAAEMVRNVGGVCGSLSNFGAAAAIANGVPAVTMGEPGHCAYAVMVAPQRWQPAYSLSWQRGVHTTFFGGSWAWHMFATAGNADPKQAWAAGDLWRRGLWQHGDGKPEQALATLAEACRTYPLDYRCWQARIQILTESSASAEAWSGLHDDILTYLAKGHPEVAWSLLRQHVYPHVLLPGESGLESRQQKLLAFHEALSGWGVSRWDFAGMLRKQQELLAGDRAEQDAFAVAAFRAHATDPILAAAVLEAGFAAIGDDATRREEFLQGVLQTVGDDGGAASADTLSVLARRLLPEAAATGDKATFQFLGRLVGKQFPPCDVAVEPFPGILLSSGGTLAIAAPGNRYDAPEQHWGVIEPHGGYFHTDAQPATVTVQLGNFGQLTGVVIVQRPSHLGRLNGAKLQVSANGEDWTDVYTFQNAGRIERINLEGRGINAGYVRVLQEGGPSLHFNRFLVFGIKQN